MAKLKGPLFSLGASQKLGNALVYFPWKGLNVVREYVIPSNPKTAGQTTQRGYLSVAVAGVHTAQAFATHPLDAIDITAYALWASVVKAATTWFNQVVKNIVDQFVAGLDAAIMTDVTLTPGANKINVKMWFGYLSGVAVTNGYLWYGTSKTALVNSQVATPAALGGAGVDITGLVAGTKYYVQYRLTAPASYLGSNSGIYYAVSA